MFKFFKKYELPFKMVAVLVWSFGAIWKFFLNEKSENRNFDLFVGIVMALLSVFYLFEVIELIRKKKQNRITGR